jgi:hypothetical protein
MAQGRPGPALTVHIPAKFNIIGQDKVWQGFTIALKLGAFFLCVQVYSNVLGFQITQEYRPPINRHVGFAALGNLPGFIGSREALLQGFKENLEGGPVGML